MSVLLIGSEGSMGKRYQSILRFLGKEFVRADKQHQKKQIRAMAENSEGVIIATPTETHADFIRLTLSLGVPVMCEKPIIKNTAELRELMKMVSSTGTKFSMMNQYKMLATRAAVGVTSYDYFRHGNDGLVWDCIQVIGLATGDVTLKEESPYWKCKINGRPLHVEHMDHAYVEYVRQWFQNPTQDLGEIVAVHEKTADFERTLNGRS